MPIGKTVTTRREDAPGFADKAEEFLRSARRALESGDHDAAMLAAIHAAITANDAACTALLGVRSADPEDQRAVDLLETIGDRAPDLAARARQLSALLKKKNLVEYEARRATAAEAREAVDRADRFVSWARGVVRPGPGAR